MDKLVTHHHDLQQIYPVNNKAQWGENDEAIFHIDCCEGYSIKNGSVKLLFQVELLKDGNPVALDDLVYVDPALGAHSFFRYIRTAIRGGVQSEDLTDYAFVKLAKSIAVRDPVDDTLKVSDALELVSGSANFTKNMLMGTVHGTHGPDGVDFYPTERRDRQVVMSPDFCLNNMMTPIPFSKTGIVEIRFGLAMASQAIWLPHGNVGGHSYTFAIKGLELQYVRVEESGAFDPRFPVLMVEKHNVNSTLLNLESMTPTFATAVSVLFYKNSQLFDYEKNSYMPFFIPGTKEVKYFFGDMDTSITAYHINNSNIILEDYVRSWMRQNKSTGFTATRRLESQGMGIGFSFNQSMVDVSSSKLRVYAVLGDATAQHAPSITNQYQAYVILHSLGSLVGV